MIRYILLENEKGIDKNIMNTKTKKLLLSTVALAAFTSTQASADDWSPRSVDQIKSELLNQDNSLLIRLNMVILLVRFQKLWVLIWMFWRN